MKSVMASAAAKTTIQRKAQLAAAVALKALNETKGDDPWAGINVGIDHRGPKIILPDSPIPMSLRTAIETLERKEEEDEQEVAVNETVDAFPKDGAVAFQKAMQRMFGWVSAVPTPGFFGSTPPTTIDVEVGPKQRISVVWGRFELPGVEGHVNCGAYGTPKGPRFRITGEVKRKHHDIVRELAEMTRQIAATESIYHNKAIAFTVTEEGEIDWQDGITFTDLSGVDPNELVFSEKTAVQIKTSLWTLIEQTERCRTQKIPLKRGILMAGKYGTGKSLTSAVTALKAVAHGWTFLSISRVQGLKDALHFARKYQPCVIFAEDVDSAVGGSDRTKEVDDILNTIDGIASKGTEIMVVLTTNHAEKINKAMIRPGRLDAIIEVTAPDEAAVKRLIRMYGRAMVDPNDPLDRCATKLAGQIPAMIRECIERAKLYAIGRTDTDEGLLVTDDDVYNAADGMQSHMDLLEGKVEEKRDPSFKEMLKTASLESFEEVLGIVSEVANDVERVDNRVRDVQGEVQAMGGGKSALIKQITQMLVDTLDRVQRIVRDGPRR
jgi:SpoVK/Ycf46/Vps4 family AAA+-type ATPase